MNCVDSRAAFPILITMAIEDGAKADPALDAAVPEAVAAWRAQQITGARLMRELVSHPAWHLPISNAAAEAMQRDARFSRMLISEDDDGVKRAFIFSSMAAYRAYQVETGDDWPQQFLSVRGSWLFQLPLDGVDFVAIDPYSDHNIAYGREHLDRLNGFAQAIAIEQALIDLRTGAAPSAEATDALLRDVAAYPGYQMAVRQTEGGMALALAPDNQDRALAAVFTQDDCADKFLADQDDDALSMLQLNGVQLFTQLRDMNLTGIVFNCGGPARPVAFALGIADVVLRAAA